MELDGLGLGLAKVVRFGGNFPIVAAIQVLDDTNLELVGGGAGAGSSSSSSSSS